MDELAPRERALLEEAASWRLIGLTLERPRAGWAETILAIGGERAVDTEVAALAARAVDEASEASFLAVFGPGGEVSPREVSYRRMGDPGRILAEIAILYETFAFMPDTEEPPDHISVEVGFISFLRLKEAYASMLEHEDEARLVREASEIFIAEHLLYVVAGLESRIGGGYLRDAVDVLAKRLGPIPAEVLASATSAQVGADFDCASGCSFE